MTTNKPGYKVDVKHILFLVIVIFSLGLIETISADIYELDVEQGP